MKAFAILGATVTSATIMGFALVLAHAGQGAAVPPRAGQATLGSEPSGRATDDPSVLEFYFKPAENLQIAIWLEDAEGNFVRDVFVTQATGKLGIGNRSGRWDFLSSWRAPYGPRPMALPVWAHRRGRTYPKIVFYDAEASDQDSLGWHESTSSPEGYYCRPLKPEEHATISTDTMTCPSPATFQTDKGRFDPDEISFYPPRNDLIEFEDDSPDAMEYSLLNDLDGVTGATPRGGATISKALTLEDLPAGELAAWIEVSLENDQNASYRFTREDHFVDPRLPDYGVGYFGQPSVVYRVQFDPLAPGLYTTDQYAGYGEWDGSSGTLYPPDDTISMSDGSGAGRLLETSVDGQSFRFGVWSRNAGDHPGGQCTVRELPPMASLTLQSVDFDTVLVQFAVPELSGGSLRDVHIYYLKGEVPITEDNLGQAVEAPCEVVPEPGTPSACVVGELHGNATYQFAAVYEDTCGNESSLVTGTTQTPRQEFAQIDTFCFVATAAYGANWLAEVGALRSFRDMILKPSPVGLAMVGFYYAYGPVLARAIEHSPLARAAVRIMLQPVANLAMLSTSRLWGGKKP